MAVERRVLGKTGYDVSVVGYGTWQLGGAWSAADDSETHKAALAAYLDAGANLLDTANVYGGAAGTDKFGWSETLIGQVLAERRAAGKTERVFVATKAGRAPTSAAPGPHGPEAYTYEALSESAAGSASRLGVECLDLLQLHCPPPEVLVDGSPTYAALRRLKAEGRIAHWGVSVETLEEGRLAIAQDDCATIQVIFNMLRQRPAANGFLAECERANVGTLIRLPLASGLLTGKITPEYVASLSESDHRRFNKAGEAFDKGETWSGLGESLEEVALPAVAELKAAFEREAAALPAGATFSQFSLRWCLDAPGVTSIIPGARTPEQSLGNLGAAALPPLTEAAHAEARRVYEDKIKATVEAEKW